MAKFNIKKLAGRVTGNVLPAAVGGIAAAAVNRIIPASLNPKLKSGIKILIGAVLPEVLPKVKMLSPFSEGWIGVSALELTKELAPAIVNEAQTAGIGEADYVKDTDTEVSVEGVGEAIFDEKGNLVAQVVNGIPVDPISGEQIPISGIGKLYDSEGNEIIMTGTDPMSGEDDPQV